MLNLEKPGVATADKVSAEIGRAKAGGRIGAIVFGCAGMAVLVARFGAEYGLSVIDGVAAATITHGVPVVRLPHENLKRWGRG